MNNQAEDGLIYGRLGQRCVHLCIDMQRMFHSETPWHTPWIKRICPAVERLASARPEQTIFTRFIPPLRAGDVAGSWRHYYERWSCMTRAELDPMMLDLIPALIRHVPPAFVFDKESYSPFLSGRLEIRLREQQVETSVVSGAETDVCVLATVLDAIDRGYRVIVAQDAICSSTNQTHDALLGLYQSRFRQQIETASVDEIIEAWV